MMIKKEIIAGALEVLEALVEPGRETVTPVLPEVRAVLVKLRRELEEKDGAWWDWEVWKQPGLVGSGYANVQVWCYDKKSLVNVRVGAHLNVDQARRLAEVLLLAANKVEVENSRGG